MGATFLYSELIEYCRIFNYKVENGSRRLREATAIGQIEAVRKKRVVIGWRVPGKQGKMW